VERIGEARGVSIATVVKHLADAVTALELELTGEEVIALEQHYTPREPCTSSAGMTGVGDDTVI
jgi:hypothetical protein